MDCINMRVITHTTQVVHCEVIGVGNSMVRLSFACVRLNRWAKEIFWEECRDYTKSFKGP